MVGLVVLAEMFTGAMEASFHRSNAGIESFGNLRVAATFLDQRQQRAILRPELGERMTQRIELLGIHRAGRLRDVFMFFAKREKNAAQLLAAELVDARVTRQPEKPRLELRRSLQTIEGSDHLDENLLGEVLDVITSTSHSVNEAGDSVLVTDNELPLGGFVALLSSSHEIGERSRRSGFHAERIGVISKTPRTPERFAVPRRVLAFVATFASASRRTFLS
jgi:hypothetical protein